MAGRRYKHGETRAIRKLSDALIDEAGERWDRIDSAGEAYCLGPDEYEPYVSRAERFVEMSHRDAPRPIEAEAFRSLTRPEALEDVCVQVFESSGRIIVAIDTSDC